MSFSTDIKDELLKLKMWDVNSNLKQEEQIARLSLREAFIKSGFITDPNKEYHLEFLFKIKKKAEKLRILLENFGLQAKTTKKGNGYITYIKDSEDIVNFLALIGANNAVLRFEETRVLKEARNNVNRLVNCETANMNKTIDASVEQIANIKKLKKAHKFEEMSEELKELANLREKNPNATLEQLGNMLKKPIGKSSVNNRFKKIRLAAEEIG